MATNLRPSALRVSIDPNAYFRLTVTDMSGQVSVTVVHTYAAAHTLAMPHLSKGSQVQIMQIDQVDVPASAKGAKIC